jgi:hypothetical protein
MMAEASALRTTIYFSGFFLEHGKDTSGGARQKIKFEKLAYFSSPKK